MSKKLSIILITLLSILLVLVIGGMIFLFNTDLDKFNFRINGIGIASGTSKKLIDEKEITNIKDIDIEANRADIFIKTSETSNIKVELYSDEKVEYEITELDNKIKVVLKYEEKTKFSFNVKSDKINVYIPANYSNTINIENKTGDIEMEDFSSANIVASLTTGDINIKEVNSATISLTTGDVEIGSAYSVKSTATTGDFDADTVRSVEVKVTTGDVEVGSVDTIKVSTTTGDIKIGVVNESIDLDTTTGDINISQATVTTNSKIKSGTGDVRIDNMASGIYVEGKSKVGDVKVDKSDRRSDVELNIETRVGDIRVK